MKSNWKPNLFVAGFAKSGSSALCDYLSQHPEVYIFDTKEPGSLFPEEVSPLWALNGKNNDQYLKWKKLLNVPFEDYKKAFIQNANKKIKIDGTQGYITGGKEIAKRINKFNPQAIIILIIRNHESRLISAFNYFYRWHQKEDLQEYIRENILPDLRSFLFYQNLKEYFEVFGKDKMIVIEAKELYSNPEEILHQIFMRLKIRDIRINRLKSNERYFFMNDSGRYKRNISMILRLLEYPSKGIVRILRSLGLFYGNPLIKYLKKVEPSKIFLNFLIKNRKNKKEEYLIPEDLKKIFIEDYKNTLKYCEENKILLKCD